MEHGKPINHSLRIRPGYESEANSYLAWFVNKLEKTEFKKLKVCGFKNDSEPVLKN